jgi:CheY-like chemotaxis protein
VIDDEASIRKVAATMLRQCGYEPIAVESAQEAADVLAKRGREVKALILDISMPGMSGDEVYRYLMARTPWLKVLIASGYRDDARVDLILSEGAQGFIQKPYTIFELSHKVGQIVS